MTALTRWNPVAEMLSLHDALAQLVENSVVRPGLPSGKATTFPVNMYQDNGTLRVEASLPGIAPENVDVNLQQGELTIAAKYQGEGPQEGQSAILHEFVTGQVTRSFSLPFPVDAERASAEFTNGVLTLTLPIVEEAKPRRIAIGGEQRQQLASGVQS